MAHYAFLDSNNKVVQVIVGKDENDTESLPSEHFSWARYYGFHKGQRCERCSYGTRGGIHYNMETGEPSLDQSKAFRKNFPGIGYTFDPERDAFIPPKPYNSWILNEETCLWEPPTPHPQPISEDEVYQWNEDKLTWEVVT